MRGAGADVGTSLALMVATPRRTGAAVAATARTRPGNCGSREERNNRRARLPATAVNPLDSAKRVYWRQREGGRGWRNNATATDDNGEDSDVIKERCRTGGGGC